MNNPPARFEKWYIRKRHLKWWIFEPYSTRPMARVDTFDTVQDVCQSITFSNPNGAKKLGYYRNYGQ